MPWRPEDRGDWRLYDHRWRRARKAQLDRQKRCEIGLDGCTIKATEVDHINGARNDPQHRHLRSACTSCHRKITAQQGGGFRSKSATTADPEPRPSTTW